MQSAIEQLTTALVTKQDCEADKHTLESQLLNAAGENSVTNQICDRIQSTNKHIISLNGTTL